MRFEKSKLLTFSSHLLNFIKQLLQIHNDCNINLAVIYRKETVFITVIYHSRTIPVSEDITATVYLFPRTIFEDIKKFPQQRYQKRKCSEFYNIQNIQRKNFKKISEFKASQLLIDKKHQIIYRFITDI